MIDKPVVARAENVLSLARAAGVFSAGEGDYPDVFGKEKPV
jgi:hypothetical protein